MWGHSIWFEGGAVRINMNSFHRLMDTDENCLLYKMDDNYLFCQRDVEVVRVYDSKEKSQTKENMIKVFLPEIPLERIINETKRVAAGFCPLRPFLY